MKAYLILAIVILIQLSDYCQADQDFSNFDENVLYDNYIKKQFNSKNEHDAEDLENFFHFKVDRYLKPIFYLNQNIESELGKLLIEFFSVSLFNIPRKKNENLIMFSPHDNDLKKLSPLARSSEKSCASKLAQSPKNIKSSEILFTRKNMNNTLRNAELYKIENSRHSNFLRGYKRKRFRKEKSEIDDADLIFDSNPDNYFKGQFKKSSAEPEHSHSFRIPLEHLQTLHAHDHNVDHKLEKRISSFSRFPINYFDNEQFYFKSMPRNSYIQQLNFVNPIIGPPVFVKNIAPKDSLENSIYSQKPTPVLPQNEKTSLFHQPTAYTAKDDHAKQPVSTQEYEVKSVKIPQRIPPKLYFQNSTYVSMLHSKKGELLCNVIHVSKNIVLTTASCLIGLNLEGCYVTVIHFIPQVKAKNYFVIGHEIHPQYDLATNDYNIALLYLNVYKEDYIRTIPIMLSSEKTYGFSQSVQIIRWNHFYFTSYQKATFFSNMGKIVNPVECTEYMSTGLGVCVKTKNNQNNYVELGLQDQGMPVVGQSKCGTEYLIGYYIGFGTYHNSTLHQFEPIYKYVDWLESYFLIQKPCLE